MAFSRAKTLHGAPEGNACTTTNPSLLSVRRTVVSYLPKRFAQFSSFVWSVPTWDTQKYILYSLKYLNCDFEGPEKCISVHFEQLGKGFEPWK